MKRSIALATLLPMLVGISACTKADPNAAPTTGPTLTAPGGSESKPAEPAPPADASKGAAIGSPTPSWENLAGTDDKTHSLKDLADAEAVAVVFTCNHCPVAQAYEDRLVKLAADYQDKGVAVVAISVSKLDDDNLAAMKERATEKGFNFAYLTDPSQESGKEFGAAVTPHAFVLDKSRKVVYMGAIDDNQQESQVKNNYLRDAVDAALAGKTPEVATSKQFGCSIHYD